MAGALVPAPRQPWRTHSPGRWTRCSGRGGLVVLRAYATSAKRAAAPWVLKGLDHTLADGYTPVLLEARQGRDRLQRDGDAFVTRRGGERFARAELERLALEAPDRLSPNVLLRPVVEAALLPTVAYAAGPASSSTSRTPHRCKGRSGWRASLRCPRWSGVIVEGRVEKLMERHGIDLAAFDGKPGELEAASSGTTCRPRRWRRSRRLRSGIEEQYGRLLEGRREDRPDARADRRVRP